MSPATTRPSPGRILAADLRAFAEAVLEALGMPADDAAIAADAMVYSDLRGAFGTGSNRLLQIAARSRGGGLALHADWTPVRETAATASLDAAGGWGPVAGGRGMRLAIDKARAVGIGVVVVRNSDVTAAMGYYPALAVREGLVGLAITNSVPLMPPWGSSQRLLGNQAFAIGAPAGHHPPLIFDSSTSAYSMGLMRAARERGEPIPPGVALGRDGRETTDAAEALDTLLLLPMGGHRGGGLAILWEVLTGVLSGGRTTTQIVGMDHLDQAMGLSLFLLALDPASFLPPDEFRARVDRLIDEVHASPPAPGVTRVRVPGERKASITVEFERDGIPIPAPQATAMAKLGAELGVSFPDR